MATAFAMALAVHAAVAVAVAGLWVWRGWPMWLAPAVIDVHTVRADELQDLPLGLEPATLPSAGAAPAEPDDIVAPPPADLPPAKSAAPAAAAAAPSPASARLTPPAKTRPKPRPRPKPNPEPVPAPPAVASGVSGAHGSGPGAASGVTSVQAYAPAGSRVVALVRIDRLRGTPYAGAVDSLLQLLPDRRDLLEGTDLDLYRDVDALLVATPNPLDALVTLLVVRHHLSDADLRTALEKGARATHRRLVWRTERGRPFAERLSADRPSAVPGTSARGRDERLIVLPAPRLAVVTPPAYRKLILETPRGRGPGPAGSKTSGSSAAGEGASWASLIDRIDAEDSILPADAVAMLSASGIFPGGSAGKGMAVMGVELPPPSSLTAVLGIAPQPFANIDLSFAPQAATAPAAGAETATAADRARAWVEAWPRLRQQLLGNPLVVLTGFGHLISGITVSETSSAVRVHLETTLDETLRILTFLTSELPLLRR